jgi:hypothetical protein
LGEPIRAFAIGNYTLEPSNSNNSPNTEQTIESLDVNLLKAKFSCNNLSDSAFIFDEQSYKFNNNKPCMVFASNLTGQLCVIPFDFLIKNSFFNNTKRLKTKCTNTGIKDLDKSKRLLYGEIDDDILDDYNIR